MKGNDSVRVRYAPSPTGDPHIGNIRTAIFDWFIARRLGGDFIVRVEDTDQNRLVEGSIDHQKESLEWLGIDWDEGLGKPGEFGPYVQSERLHIYHEITDTLIESENAYRCFCSPDRLKELRQEQRSKKMDRIGYDGHCRGLSSYERAENLDSGREYVVRFAMPTEGTSFVDDLIRGKVEFENGLVEDFVILKSDKFPTYHLASVVDDHLMNITHVLRGEEWLSSVPRHIQIYHSLGWDIPFFAHLPTILAPDRSKLSKRHGATSIMEYKQMGFVPEAMVNFLSLLGWSYDGETEIVELSDMISRFDISEVNGSGAVFDMEKLTWMNGNYIRQMDSAHLGDLLYDFWTQYPPREFDREPDRESSRKVASLVSERLKTLTDAAPLVAFLYSNEIEYSVDQLIQKQMDHSATLAILEEGKYSLKDIQEFSAQNIETELRILADKLKLKPRHVLGTIRVATSGQKISPPLFGSLELLGKSRTINLIDQAVNKLQAN